jgi:hypothetical protein
VKFFCNGQSDAGCATGDKGLLIGPRLIHAFTSQLI